jgi:hypothetical protein
MAKPRGPGRPKSNRPLRKLRAVYLTDAEYKACVAAAGGRLFSQWATDALLKAAGKGTHGIDR